MSSAPTVPTTLDRADGVHVVTVEGDIDVATADLIGDVIGHAIDQASPRARVIVDCADVPMVDSRGLGMMLSAQRHANRRDRTLSWAGLSDHVRKVLAVTASDATVVVEPAPQQHAVAR